MNRKDETAELVYNLVCPSWFLCDFRIQPDKRIFDHLFDHDIRMHTWQVIGRNILPTVGFQRINEHGLNSVIFVKWFRHDGTWVLYAKCMPNKRVNVTC